MNEIKKQILLWVILLLMLLVGGLTAQSRFPISAGSVWRINYEFSETQSGTHAEGDEIYKYFVNGDTIIGDNVFFKLYKSGIMYLDSPYLIEDKYMGAIRDADNKFYYIAKGKAVAVLLYDFNAAKGDYFLYNGKSEMQVDELDTLPDGRKRFLFYLITVHCGSANTIVEGIGWLGGLLEGNSCFGHPGIRGSYTVCYSENGETKFLSTEAMQRGYTSCTDIPTFIKKPAMLKPKVWLNGNMLQLNFEKVFGSNVQIELYNILGIKVLQRKCSNSSENSFNINGLTSGNYIVRLRGDSESYTSILIKF